MYTFKKKSCLVYYISDISFTRSNARAPLLVITQILKTMKLYITRQLDFGTQIYTQKYTKHYYLIKLKTQLEFDTQIYTEKYKSITI
jgi:hypothetical protein